MLNRVLPLPLCSWLQAWTRPHTYTLSLATANTIITTPAMQVMLWSSRGSVHRRGRNWLYLTYLWQSCCVFFLFQELCFLHSNRVKEQEHIVTWNGPDELWKWNKRKDIGICSRKEAVGVSAVAGEQESTLHPADHRLQADLHQCVWA